MTLRTLATICALTAGLAASTTALGGQMTNAFDAGQLIRKISCDTRNEDKQAQCMVVCDDEYIKASQAYTTAGNLDGPKAAKKACDAKCGC